MLRIIRQLLSPPGPRPSPSFAGFTIGIVCNADEASKVTGIFRRETHGADMRVVSCLSGHLGVSAIARQLLRNNRLDALIVLVPHVTTTSLQTENGEWHRAQKIFTAEEFSAVLNQPCPDQCLQRAAAEVRRFLADLRHREIVAMDYVFG